GGVLGIGDGSSLQSDQTQYADTDQQNGDEDFDHAEAADAVCSVHVQSWTFLTKPAVWVETVKERLSSLFVKVVLDAVAVPFGLNVMLVTLGATFTLAGISIVRSPLLQIPLPWVTAMLVRLVTASLRAEISSE